MKEWVFQLSKDNYESLGPVRCLPGLEAAFEENKIWLRMPASAVPDVNLLKLPLKKTFMREEGNLFSPGTITPVEKLPALHWQPIASFIHVESPVSTLPGQCNEKVSIQLTMSGKNHPGAALLTSLPAWKLYAEYAPEARLKAVRFAVSENKEVLIIGNPLPPLPGNEYWKHKNLLIPCGYDFEIPLVASLINQKLQEGDKDVILLDTIGAWQRIPCSYFITASRSAIRLTQVKDQHG